MASRSCQFINRQRHDNARIKSKENRRRSQSHNSPINGLYPLDRGMMKQGSYAFGSSGKKIISSSFISYNRHQNRAYDSAYKKPVASAYLPKWRKLSNISTPGTNVARANSCRQEEATELIASTLKGESAGSSAVSVSGAVEEENLSLSGCENSFTAEEECQLRIDDNGSSVTMDGSLYAADIPQNVDPRQEIESGICLHPYSCSPRASKNSSSFDDDKHSPTLTEQLREISNTLKALSSRPICIYTSEIDEPYIEPKTPRLPFSSNLDGHFMSESFTTPQEKFKTRSIGLKKSLMNECLDFLNSASKEELKQLKGIGEKRATRILQLREQTPKPFKEIDDLKGLGLSSKQVKGMMSKVLDI
ncbi:hypothetical protein AXF42_Ash019591 [Apostasia shenzhenica]|uniref:Kinesin-like protein KIF22 n=1 Tax=Apostasia shenzhenica TaxID=1088818 RepID=A0A2I0AV74_9ASPA|nr:hypothetical protein AXF42_Ash019591 [Apostasia shenzhenica]